MKRIKNFLRQLSLNINKNLKIIYNFEVEIIAAANWLISALS
jgi:hypothetical protein